MTKKNKYLIKWPYSMTILFLVILGISLSFIYVDNWIPYIATLIFTTLFGISQIDGLENRGNIPAWFFPQGSSFFQDKGYRFYKNIIWEDLIFIPCCSSLFYAFMFLTKDVTDVLNNEIFICVVLLIFVIIEAKMYELGGLGGRILMVPYTLGPIIILLIANLLFKNFNLYSINITHSLLTLGFCIFINCGWELINSWRRHWIYNCECELFGEKGWMLKGKLHVSIFFQFPFSGWIVMYSCWIGFNFLFQ